MVKEDTMVRDALAGKIDLIITKSVSRFARSTVDSLTTVRKLKDNGIEVYFEKENIWTLDAKGEPLITIMSSLAQEESRSISENVTWGQRKRMADGKVSFAYSRFLGLDKDKETGKIVVNPEQAETVRLIFHLFLEGMTPSNFVSHIAKVLPDDIIAKLDELGAQEDAPLSKVIYETMKRNQKLAKELNRPSCQDTGVLQFWVKCGVDFPLIGEVEGLLKEAVVKSTFEAPLRHNSVETFDEFNTGRNVGKGTPTVWWDIIPNSDKCEIYAYMAGGGCTLPGKAMVLMPGAGYEGVTKFVMDVMTSYGINACPPLLVGVGVATSVETAALLSKKALMRPLGSHNENERAAYMEKLLEDGINSIGLGPQGMGGKYSVMGVHIENTARHPSAIGVAVNVGCWSHRRGHIIFDKDLNYTIDTHSGVTL